MNEDDEKAKRQHEVNKKLKALRNKWYNENCKKRRRSDPLLEQQHQKKLKLAWDEAQQFCHYIKWLKNQNVLKQDQQCILNKYKFDKLMKNNMMKEEIKKEIKQKKYTSKCKTRRSIYSW